MAGAPPIAFRSDRRAIWQWGVALLVVLSCAAMVSWWLVQPAPPPGWTGALAAFASMATLACGAALLRTGAGTELRWDGQRWWHARATAEPVVGEVGVAVDLGDWMLLRFTPTSAGDHIRAHWIPVQRRGHEADWHALRCAVHGQRPHESGAGRI